MMVFPHGPSPAKKKEPSPWVVFTTIENKKIFMKRDNILAISSFKGAAHQKLTGIQYIDDYNGDEIVMTVGVVETIEYIWSRL